LKRKPHFVHGGLKGLKKLAARRRKGKKGPGRRRDVTAENSVTLQDGCEALLGRKGVPADIIFSQNPEDKTKKKKQKMGATEKGDWAR